MALERSRERLNARVDSVRRLLRTEADILKGALSDIKQRIDLSTSKSLPYTSNRGALLGKEGSLIKIPAAVIADTIDNIARFSREQAEITRRIFAG